LGLSTLNGRAFLHIRSVAIHQLVAGALVSGIGVLLTGAGVESAGSMLPWFGLLYGVVAGTAVAYALWYKVLDHLPAATAGLGTLLVPVFGVTASMILLGEQPTLADLIGFALVLMAAAIALGPPAQPCLYSKGHDVGPTPKIRTVQGLAPA
jgi:drug/metabolite transporter (DMT)-like permease